MFTFANLSQHLTISNIYNFDPKISKNFHNQADTNFCWAFAISSMLHSSLLKCIKAGTDAMKRIKAEEFHKILRSEILMGPIPKPKYIDNRESTSGRKDKILDAQGHFADLAVQRVTYNLK